MPSYGPPPLMQHFEHYQPSPSPALPPIRVPQTSAALWKYQPAQNILEPSAVTRFAEPSYQHYPQEYRSAQRGFSPSPELPPQSHSEWQWHQQNAGRQSRMWPKANGIAHRNWEFTPPPPPLLRHPPIFSQTNVHPANFNK